ncbi:MAG: hypothetical protein IKU42_08325 [Oscillospiraceae bacterium]|nr:hypothetical protein [Oscillospiraceae bacterium]
MKKLLAFILALLMVLSLSACSNEPEVQEPVIDEPVSEEPEEIETDIEIIPKRGTVDGFTYKNEVFGISFFAGEDWYYYTDEEIAANMGIAAEEMLIDEYADALTASTLIYDMYCLNTKTSASINVNYENTGMSYDEEYYLEISKTQLENQLNQSGYVLAKNEISSASINGKEVPCLDIIIDFGGMYIYETIVVNSVGDWMGVVTVASLDEAELAEILKNISFD